MSEVKLNLIDAQQVLHGTIHGSVADSAVAALSAEPETIAELEAALARFQKPISSCRPFAIFHSGTDIDEVPWDAGIVIIDLAARIVASESTYSCPAPEGEVRYHDGEKSTDYSIAYRVPEDWVFLHSVEEYLGLYQERSLERAANPPLDAREILYGRPLLEWIVETINREGPALWSALERKPSHDDISDVPMDYDTNPISLIHARWLMTQREDLRGQSPRDVLFAKRDFIDFDLNSREMQWSFLDEGPPCLSVDSFAYRFAGFGIHEWVIYYDLVRHLLWSALLCQRLSSSDIAELKHGASTDSTPSLEPELAESDIRSRGLASKEERRIDKDSAILELEEITTAWLEHPHSDYGRIPAVLIENERKRLPIAMSPREMIVDENCPTCQMFADETALGLGVGFWHLDGCNMDEGFVFSHHRTYEEWEAERREWKAFSENFNREWEEKQARIARGESFEDGVIMSGVITDLDLAEAESAEGDETGQQRGWGPRGFGIV